MAQLAANLPSTQALTLSESAHSASEATRVPITRWADHHARMVDNWEQSSTPHVSIISPTGNGKSYLVGRGLIPALRDEQVMLLDAKGWDSEINRLGFRTVRKFPTQFERRLRDSDREYSRCYRFMATDPVSTATLVEKCYNEGNWTIIFDEERAIADTPPEGLGLKGVIEKIRLRGRGRVSAISGTQAPRFVGSSFYDQASHLYLARLEDARTRKRLQEIGGNSKVIDYIVSRLGRYEYLYIGPLTERGVRRMEIVKVGV